MAIWRALEVRGKDSKDFLHRLTTAHVQMLSVGYGSLGLLLEATAKLIASFTLLLPEADRYLLIFATDVERERAFSSLERLHFSEALEIQMVPGEGGVLLAEAEELNQGPLAQCFPIKIEAEALLWPSFIPNKIEAFSEKPLSFLPELDFELARITAGRPMWGKEFGPEANALDCGLLPWIHENKGCYPGQEVVERSLRVGHPARALVKVEGKSELIPGEPLIVEGKEVGKVTSAYGIIALGIVQWKFRERDRFERSNGGELQCRK